MASVNVDSLGGGRLDNSFMRNGQLSIYSKAIYAYYCSFEGAGCVELFASETVIYSLAISKATYLKHLNSLIADDYITVIESNEQQRCSILKLAHDRNSIFGFLPRILMLDTRLSIAAKMVYAYLNSFSSQGSASLPDRKVILDELHLSQNKFNLCCKDLIQYGYITVHYDAYGNKILSLNDSIEYSKAS